jgi:putative ABC transport system permease protein
MRRLAALLLRLYPREFRERYGTEVLEAFESSVRIGSSGRLGGARALVMAALDLLRGAAFQWISRARGPGRPREADLGSGMGRSVAYAARRLRRSPVFTIVSLLTLTLGIGAGASVFSLVNGVLIRPLPYPNADDLVFVFSDLTRVGVPRAAINGGHALRLQEEAERFSGFTHLHRAQGSLAPPDGEGARPVMIGFTGPNLFEVLAVEPRLGRGFQPDEAGPGAPPVMVLTDRLWRSAFGADPAVIGSTAFVDGEPYTVVGVTPRDFDFQIHVSIGDPVTPDLFLPSPEDLAEHGPDWGFSFSLLGRILPEVEHAAAFAELDRLASRFGDDDWNTPDFRFDTVYLGEDLVAEARPLLVLLLAAVGVLLLIVSSNLATLFLARGIARGHSTAVELALGAGRRRIFASAMVEPIALALAGATGGVLLAYVAVDTVRALVPPTTPRIAEVGIDPVVVVSAFAAALAVGVLTGLVPAFAQGSVSVADTLRMDGNRTGSRQGALRSQRILVGAQIALSCALLVSGAGIGRSLLNLVHVDPGFEGERRLTFAVALPDARYDAGGVLAFYDELERRLAADPAVVTVGRVRHLPLGGRAEQRTFSFGASPGATGDIEEDQILVDRLTTSAGLAAALELDVLDGRWFDDRDASPESRSLVIDHLLAGRYWPGRSAVGGEVQPVSDTVPWTVVGVVRQPRLHDLGRDGRPQIWVPHATATHATMHVVAQARTDDPLEVVPLVREVVADLDPMVAVSEIRTGDALVGDAVARWRFALLLMGLFGAAALLLAVLGVYGVIAHSVARRTRELGIRRALGAPRGALAGMVMAQGLRLVAVGLVMGIGLAWAGSRLLTALLYQVRARDPLAVLIVAVLILITAVAATAIPASRAARVSPARAFRAD